MPLISFVLNLHVLLQNCGGREGRLSAVRAAGHSVLEGPSARRHPLTPNIVGAINKIQNQGCCRGYELPARRDGDLPARFAIVVIGSHHQGGAIVDDLTICEARPIIVSKLIANFAEIIALAKFNLGNKAKRKGGG
jgi:hypothetical protein